RGRAALRDERLDWQEQQRAGERNLEALFVAALERARHLAPLHGRDVVTEHLIETETRAEPLDVCSPRGQRDVLQRFIVEARLHDLPAAILDESALLERQQLSFRGTDADGEDLHPRILGALRRLL